MLILTLRTDKPEAELGLYDDDRQLAYIMWQAHRQLAETLHTKIKELLEGQGKKLQDLQGVVCFQGPGSFTGLRIGLTTANALAYALELPIVAQISETDDKIDTARPHPLDDAASDADTWRSSGIKRLLAGQSDPLALPEYGAEANITRPAANPDQPSDPKV